ncbi:hypothetical protein GGR56DRAFT_117277 [Xylariaceae sp. FL0804]|nr:hypothetical protein GGR56DRAFT_117277 [Xylariaceae sp. FL0804]
MSSTMTMTLPSSSPKTGKTTMPATTTTITQSCCPSCGLSLPASSSSSAGHPDSHAALLQQAQQQIEDLQAQVRLLNQKAVAAVDRWADYEDELSRLRATLDATNKNTNVNNISTVNATPERPLTPAPSQPATSPRTSFLLPTGAASRISQLLSSRKSTPNLSASPSEDLGNNRAPSPEQQPQPQPELAAALARERQLRAAAEGKLRASSDELEELSAALFEQANGMVADERRARAALEDRVAVLERRDEEKRGRLSRLEGAINRVERARALLDGGVDEFSSDEETEEETEDEESQGRRSAEGKRPA